MLVAEARRQAGEWVEREASQVPGFIGAYLTGSTKWKPGDAVHSPSSDVDVRVLVDGSEQTREWKKSRYRDILLEAAAVARDDMGSLDAILPNPFLAGSLWHPVVLADPTGEIAELGRKVTAEFPRRHWVEQRMGAARGVYQLWLRRMEEADSFPEQATCWLFGASATTLVLLAAGLRNLTVRRRYAECRALLEEHGQLDFYQRMLEWLGCVDLSAARVREHLAALGVAYDAVGEHLDPTFRFAADLRPDARCIAIDGSRELIDSGLHREAIFWLVSTFSRCLQGLRPDAPESVRALCDAGFRDLLRDLGIGGRGVLESRARLIRAGAPRLDGVAAQIVASTPEIVY